MVVQLKVGNQGCRGVFSNERMTESKRSNVTQKEKKPKKKKKNSPARERAAQAICYRGVAGMPIRPSIEVWCSRIALDKYTMNCSNYMCQCIFQRNILAQWNSISYDMFKSRQERKTTHTHTHTHLVDCVYSLSMC